MKEKLKILTAGLLLTMAAGCAGVGQNSSSQFNNSLSNAENFNASSAAKAAAKADPRTLADVKTWAMPPETSDLTTLAATLGDLLVVTPPVDKTGAFVWTDKQITTLKQVKIADAAPTDEAIQNGAAKDEPKTRRVLASLTISQTPADPKDIPGDKNGFWTDDNQKSVTAKLDKLAALGFDGVVLDGVGDYAKYGKERPAAASDMANFVETLGAHVRQKHKNFVFLTRNAAALPLALAEKPRAEYWKAIDGIVAENTFYAGDKPSDNDLKPQADVLSALDAFQKARKPIFARDSLHDEKKQADFVARATARGWIVSPVKSQMLTSATPPAAPTSAPDALTATR